MDSTPDQQASTAETDDTPTAPTDDARAEPTPPVAPDPLPQPEPEPQSAQESTPPPAAETPPVAEAPAAPPAPDAAPVPDAATEPEAPPSADLQPPVDLEAHDDEDNEDTPDDETAVEPAPDVVEQNPEAVEATDAEPATKDQEKGKRKKGGKPDAKPQPKKPAGPDPAEVTRRIGSTNEAAVAYVLAPDPQLSRLSRKVRETLITDVPPVTAGALLGPDALARHFVASAAAGRYRDLFSLWELFRQRPDEIRPVLAERQRALERARQALQTAVRLGLSGRADRVAEDIARAEGLIWTWLRETLNDSLAAVGRRPAIAAALLAREPDLVLPLPDEPSERWLTEAAAVRATGPLPEPLNRLLSASIDRLPPGEDTLALVAEHYPERMAGLVDRLPATVTTLSLVAEQFKDRLAALVDRVDLESPEIGSILAWARDHGVAERIADRVRRAVEEAAARDRAAGLADWHSWRERGVDVALPDSLRAPNLEGLDLARPETAFLVARLVGDGAPIDPQAELDTLAGQNRQLAEKAYEAFVCAELDVHLPLALEGNPIVRDGTRCPACQAWTWVRPGHENRCPRLRAEQAPTA